MNNKDQTQYAATMWEIAEVMQSIRNSNEKLSEGFRLVVEAAKGEVGTVWIKNETDNRLYASFLVGKTDEAMRGMSLRANQGVAGQVVSSQQSVLVEDCMAHAAFDSNIDKQTGFTSKSMVCVPLKTSTNCIGCIQMINKLDGGTFSQQDLELCENLASFVAIVIEKQGLFLGEIVEREILASFQGLEKEFQTGNIVTKVLKGLDLTIHKGEFLVILGPSGCGKTTFLNIIGCLDKPTAGRYECFGVDVAKMEEKELTILRRDKIGFVFQDYSLLPMLTVSENLKLVGSKEQTKEMLDAVGLSEFEDKYPAQLSGGQQQRVAIARALINNPEIIVADEPTAALDTNIGMEILALLQRLVIEKGCTLVLVTHNTQIARIADRVVRMKDGNIVSVISNAMPERVEDVEW